MTIYSPQLRGEIQLLFLKAKEQLISLSFLIVSVYLARHCLHRASILVCDIMTYGETFGYQGVHLRVQFPILDTPPYGSLWCT